MRLRFILTIVMISLSTMLYAQERVEGYRVPDEDDIIHQTLIQSSPYYYTNLLLKYQNGTEPLTDEEYFYLYYGYIYQEDYRPFVPNDALDRTLDILAGIDPRQPTIGQLEALIENGVESMKMDPFSPRVLNILAYAYGALGDKHREQLYFNHMNGILRTIESTGSGVKENSPLHILMFSHAYDVLAAKGYTYNESRIISRNVEYIPLTKKTHDRIKGFYFDYSRVYRNKPDDVVIKRERTWQFNNLKPREYK